MFVDPSIHLELARQRQQDLLVEAERRRTVKRRVSASPTALTRGVARHADVTVGLEV
jgi:nucleotide-binding universal stress UspA family protein